MKITLQVKLLPNAAEAAALAETLRVVNKAACWVSQVAFTKSVTREYPLRGLTYGSLKEQGLGAQVAQHVIKKVADAYTALKATVRAGNLRSKRNVKAVAAPIAFRPDAAHPFDDRCLSWQHDAQTVSIWTVRGRIRNIRFTGHPHQLATVRNHRRGETDLVYRDGKWFLVAVCEVSEPSPIQPMDWIGVDRGIVNLATTSDGENHQGRRLGRYRRWQARLRAELQAVGTRSATRRLRRRARRERRHAQHINHRIAKRIVAVAERTGRGIALEELSGIRERVRLSRHQRATLSSWPFRHLGHVIAYKARRAGVPVVWVDAAYTSQTCPRCRSVTRSNRPTRDTFSCRSCGFAGHADHVAAINVRNRARVAWVFVNMPESVSA
ncbi:RNA-guided endonuclease InsQ/TnpB family protein [Kibdelosporangium aridum]|uniref:RNA-guided endonuclease InsQ/TnpB family protein n=1 Tax=Kibdelosporangium aridum TaxID=2030 RepID=UPI0035E8F483